MTSDLSADFKWAAQKGGTVVRLLAMQCLTQCAGLLAAVLCVRGMAKLEFAWFTIASSLVGALAVLADSGIGAGLQALAGRVWPDRERLARYVRAAQRLRRRIATAVALLIGPPFAWLLNRNEAPWLYALLLAAMAYATVWVTTTSVTLAVPVRLNARYGQVQRADLGGACVRVLSIAVAFLTHINAAVASACTICGALVQRALLGRSYAATVRATRTESDTGEEERQLARYVKPLAAPTLFFVLQGQITVWLIALFGTAPHVAELGAIGRFAAVFGVFGAVVTLNAGASFARCKSRADLSRQVRRVGGGAIAVLSLPLVALLAAPRVALLLLGPGYAHLSAELQVLAVTSFLTTVNALVWALNTGRGWVHGAWLLIPTTLVSQALALIVVDPSSVLGVLALALVHVLATAAVYLGLAVRGWRRWGPERDAS